MFERLLIGLVSTRQIASEHQTARIPNNDAWHQANHQASKPYSLKNQLHVMINKGIGILNQLSHRERHILQGHPGLFKKKIKKKETTVALGMVALKYQQ